VFARAYAEANKVIRLRRHDAPEVIECEHPLTLHDVRARSPSARKRQQLLEPAGPLDVHAKWRAVDSLDGDSITPLRYYI